MSKLDRYEATLSQQQWLSGATPGQTDKIAINEISETPDVKKHPFLFAWYSFASKFSPEMMASWKAEDLSWTQLEY
jgi:hypothetical protein